MTKRMLIAVDEEESRVAIIDGRRLENLEIEAHGGEGRRGNIYKGVVHKVEQSLQAAFIDFGEEKQGFLPLSEIHRRLWPEGVSEKRPDITNLLKEGQHLMVQVVKDEIGTKGATLTTYVSLPGRYLVLMPESDKSGISRRLGDTERRRLKETIDSIGVPDGFGVIIRTAGQQQRPLELKKDLLYLTKLYETIEQKHKERSRAGLVYKDRSHAVRFVRDYFTPDIEEVWCDNRSTLKEISEFMGVLMPSAKQKLRLYEGDAPLFIKFGVEDQIESVFARQVFLPGGGSIVLDQTEALVSIDVNSGRVKGQDIEETALMTNLEAADEVARQVKIRDLGGLVVVDFIDMRDRKNNRAVEQRLRKAFQDDKSKIKFGRISQFGLMELSRQRLRKSLASSITRRCTACDGTGRVRAPASAALSLLRRVEEACLRGNVKYIRATTPVSIANLLLNRRRREMMELENKLGVVVEVVGHKDMPANLVALDVVIIRGGRAAPQRIYQLLDLIRNEVVRKESSPLPKPEDGLEALELDHTAIYRAIAERDALLKAEAEKDEFEYEPREPDLDQIEEDERKRAERRDEKERARARSRQRSRDRSDDDKKRGGKPDEERRKPPSRPARDPAVVAAEEAAAAEAEAAEAEHKRGGFLGWMKRIFGAAEDEMTTGEGGAEVSGIGPITEEVIEKVESETAAKRPARSASDDDDDERSGGRGRRRSRSRRRRRGGSSDRDQAASEGSRRSEGRSDDGDSSDSDDSGGEGRGRSRRRRRSRSRSRSGGGSGGEDQQQSRGRSGDDGDGGGQSDRRRRRSRSSSEDGSSEKGESGRARGGSDKSGSDKGSSEKSASGSDSGGSRSKPVEKPPENKPASPPPTPVTSGDS